ncbi:nucleoside diphosphate-linked moiety X motif 8-like isoform X1 [Copidosoma floridanum]|uniref:nucleoside diphosphate-linked moiety X motif 8-like isoform X1 n=1 Tax=Copidosoma floridanum TaxID=29053 RepID=UPI0006C9AEDF|nr:nucleoside diphosphate-linked moiety X motif 8-like isoform X1 [Copidosoma floridanum]XP_023244920.1 nucleoside diphosphate-linked moiety X motif 8-like isoform X1 [Copidosoma floridanum]
MFLRTLRRKAELFSSSSLSGRKLSSAEKALLSPEALLDGKIRSACVERLQNAQVFKPSKNSAIKSAAVLVPLCIHNGKLGLLYTLRSTKVSMNRGQVSFPGGMKDKNDATLEDTALRETEEELNIARSDIEIWGSGNLIVRKEMAVLPVLGFIGRVEPKSLKVNTNEVEKAFVQPLEKLCDLALCRYTQFRNNYTMPVYLVDNYKIWGLTAAITHIVMQALVPKVYKHNIIRLNLVSREENQ